MLLSFNIVAFRMGRRVIPYLLPGQSLLLSSTSKTRLEVNISLTDASL